MITIFGTTFSIVGLAVWILLLFFIITQASWWLFRKYFPALGLCLHVHKYARTWFAKQRKLLAALDSMSVFGFICTLLLLAIIPLNVTILAQVFEVFVPPGDRIVLPLIDSYGTFPLLIGVLFALVEVAFSALLEQRRQQKNRYWPILVVLGLMILVEVGLNFYRSWIMESDGAIMPTFWDKIIGIGGPLLAAFIGLIVPLAMVLLGGPAMLDFIMPAIKNTILIARYLIANLIIGLLVGLFGFHSKKPIVLPESIGFLHNQSERLKMLYVNLERSLDQVKSLYAEISRFRLKDPATLETQVHALEQQIVSLEDKVPIVTRSGEPNSPENIFKETIPNRQTLRKVMGQVKVKIRGFYHDIRDNANKFQLISGHTLAEKSTNECLKEKLAAFEKLSESVQSQLTCLENQFQETKILDSCNLILSALNGEVATFSSVPTVIQDLRDLIAPQEQMPKVEKDWRKLQVDGARSILSTVRAELSDVQKKMQVGLEWCHNHRLAIGTQEIWLRESRIEKLENQLIDLDQRLEKAEKQLHDYASDFQVRLREIALQYKAIVLWLTLLTPMHRKLARG